MTDPETQPATAYKLEVYVMDFDNLGEEGVKSAIENARYPGRCISPKVKAFESREVQWHDQHPLNLNSQHDLAYGVLFRRLPLCTACKKKLEEAPKSDSMIEARRKKIRDMIAQKARQIEGQFCGIACGYFKDEICLIFEEMLEAVPGTVHYRRTKECLDLGKQDCTKITVELKDGQTTTFDNLDHIDHIEVNQKRILELDTQKPRGFELNAKTAMSTYPVTGYRGMCNKGDRKVFHKLELLEDELTLDRVKNLSQEQYEALDKKIDEIRGLLK